eukprot:gene13895-biopygen17054
MVSLGGRQLPAAPIRIVCLPGAHARGGSHRGAKAKSARIRCTQRGGQRIMLSTRHPIFLHNVSRRNDSAEHGVHTSHGSAPSTPALSGGSGHPGKSRRARSATTITTGCMEKGC